MCVPCVHMCVCAFQEAHVCFPAQRIYACAAGECTLVWMLGLKLLPTNGFPIKPLIAKLLAGEQKATECVCVCAHGCTSARAACTFSVVYICVFHVCTHVCLNWTRVSELPA